MSGRAELIKRVRANPDDHEAWLVLADSLEQEGSPWGEYIVLRLKHDVFTAPRKVETRLRKIAKTWRETTAPWVIEAEWWPKWAFHFTARSVDDFLEHAARLRALELPLTLDVQRRPSDASDRCFFDERYERFALMEHSTTYENINHSPGMDETVTRSSHLKVWRVENRTVLLDTWRDEHLSRLEFRDGSLFAINGSNEEKLALPG